MALGKSPVSDIAWAAGFFEGEGCITLGNHSARLAVGSTDLDVLEKFQAIVGAGKIAQMPRSNLGKKDIWAWRTAQFEYVQAIIAAFWPWLGSRRRARAAEILKLGASTGRGQKYRSRRYNGNRCAKGHEMTSGNSYVNPSGRVKCRQCGRAHRLTYKARLILRKNGGDK